MISRKNRDAFRRFIASPQPDFCISLLPKFSREPEAAEAIATCGLIGATLRVIR